MNLRQTRPADLSAEAGPLPQLLTVKDAMTIGRIGKTSLYSAAAKGAFPLKKFGRRTLIPRVAFMEFLRALPDAEIGKSR